MSKNAILTFPQPKPWELKIYEHIARQMYSDHMAKHSEHPILGILYSLGDEEVQLFYYVPNGNEEAGVRYNTNAVTSKFIGHLLAAARILEEAGL